MALFLIPIVQSIDISEHDDEHFRGRRKWKCNIPWGCRVRLIYKAVKHEKSGGTKEDVDDDRQKYANFGIFIFP